MFSFSFAAFVRGKALPRGKAALFSTVTATESSSAGPLSKSALASLLNRWVAVWMSSSLVLTPLRFPAFLKLKAEPMALSGSPLNPAMLTNCLSWSLFSEWGFSFYSRCEGFWFEHYIRAANSSEIPWLRFFISLAVMSALIGESNSLFSKVLGAGLTKFSLSTVAVEAMFYLEAPMILGGSMRNCTMLAFLCLLVSCVLNILSFFKIPGLII